MHARFVQYIALLLLACLPLHAEDGHKNPEPLTIITIDLSSSVERADTAFGAKGTIAEYLQKGTDDCGLKASVIFAPSWNRAYAIAASGRADAIIPTHKTAEREKLFDFTAYPLRETQMTIYTDRHIHSTHISRLEDLNGKRVGILLGAMLETKFDAYVRSGGPIKSEQHSYAALVENLSRHKLDYIAGSNPVIRQEIINQGLSAEIAAVTPHLGVENVYLALSKKRHHHKDLNQPAIRCLMEYNFLQNQRTDSLP